MEQRMVLICDGQRARREVLDETLDEYRQVFLKARQQFGTLIDASLLYCFMLQLSDLLLVCREISARQSWRKQ